MALLKECGIPTAVRAINIALLTECHCRAPLGVQGKLSDATLKANPDVIVAHLELGDVDKCT